MEVGDGARDRLDERRGSPRLERPLVEEVLERLPLDELHGEPGDAVLGARVVDAHDVRVVDPRERLRLALEALEELAVARERRLEDLERDRARGEVVVVRAVDDPHGAARDLGLDGVAAEARRERLVSRGRRGDTALELRRRRGALEGREDVDLLAARAGEAPRLRVREGGEGRLALPAAELVAGELVEDALEQLPRDEAAGEDERRELARAGPGDRVGAEEPARHEERGQVVVVVCGRVRHGARSRSCCRITSRSGRQLRQPPQARVHARTSSTVVRRRSRM